jgi:hypothetical protein
MQEVDKEYDVKVTDTAWEQLLEHAKFLANVSEGAANRLVDDLLEKSDTLKHMPERCPWLSHDNIPFQKYRKLFIDKYHLALFEIRGSIVYISAVVDCRQDYSMLL